MYFVGGYHLTEKEEPSHAVRLPVSFTQPRRDLARAIPCVTPISPATMLSTTENATVADGKETGVMKVGRVPGVPQAIRPSARGAR